MRKFESCRPGLRVYANPILKCRGSNPSASTGQSVSNACGIGSPSQRRDMAPLKAVRRDLRGRDDKATAPEATEAAAATPSRIGGHTCYDTREAAIQKKPRRSGASST
jgi:hypothetical protein